MASSFAGIFNNSDPTGAGLSSDLYQNQERQSVTDLNKERLKQEQLATQELTEQWKVKNLINQYYKDHPPAVTPKGDHYDPAASPNGVASANRPTLAGDAPDSLVPDGAGPAAATATIPGAANSIAGGMADSRPWIQAEGGSGVMLPPPYVAPGTSTPAPAAEAPAPSGNSIASAVEPSAVPFPATVPPVPNGPDGQPLKPMDKRDPSTYNVDFDMNGLMAYLARNGYATGGNAYVAERTKAMQAVATLYETQHKNAAAKNESLANLVAPIANSPVDFNPSPTNTPQQIQQNAAAKQAQLLQQLKFGVQSGVIDATMEQQLEQEINQGYNPTVQAHVQNISRMATGAAEQERQAGNDWAGMQQRIKLPGELAQQAATTRDANARTNLTYTEKDQKDLANMAQRASGITDLGPSLDAFYNDLPNNAKAAAYDIYQNAKTGAKVNGPGGITTTLPNAPSDPAKLQQVKSALAELGMTADQKATIAIRQAGQDSLEAYRDSSLDIRKQLASIAAEREAKGTATDKAAIRTAQTRVLSLQKQEEPLYKMIGQLQTALKGGNAYVTNTGNVQSRTPDDGEKADMTTRLNSAITTAQNLINTKYDIMEENNASPRMSREDALAGVGAVRQAGKNAPASATPQAKPNTTANPVPAVTPKPTAKAAPKPIDAPTLNGYLKKAGWSGSGTSTPAQRSKAQKLAEADGYEFPK